MRILQQDLDGVLERTRPIWDELKTGRMFVTGGTGFFGRWILETFAHANSRLNLGAQAVVLTRDPDAFRQRAPHLEASVGITFQQGDISTFGLPDGSFTHVIHAASELSVARPKDPVKLIETTLIGTRRVLDLARSRGARKILFTSSGAAYGPMYSGRGKIAEADLVSPVPLDPRGAYAEAKRLAELISCIEGGQSGIEVKIARGFAFIGPFLALDSHLAAAGFLRAALTGEPIIIQGHGQTVRSYLYGADLAVWLWTILFKGRAGQPYNLGSDVPITIAELAREISQTGTRGVAVEILGKRDNSELIDVYLPDLTKVRSELGLDVFTPIAESIRRTLAFHHGE